VPSRRQGCRQAWNALKVLKVCLHEVWFSCRTVSYWIVRHRTARLRIAYSWGKFCCTISYEKIRINPNFVVRHDPERLIKWCRVVSCRVMSCGSCVNRPLGTPFFDKHYFAI
jgi:hypothetical protein